MNKKINDHILNTNSQFKSISQTLANIQSFLKMSEPQQHGTNPGINNSTFVAPSTSSYTPNVFLSSVTTASPSQGNQINNVNVRKPTVSYSKKPGILVTGGQGIAKVTKPGLGLEIGSHAINPVPRKNIPLRYTICRISPFHYHHYVRHLLRHQTSQIPPI